MVTFHQVGAQWISRHCWGKVTRETTGDLPDGRVELISLRGDCVFADRIENVTEYRKTVGLLPGFYIARYVGPQQVISRKVRVGEN